MRAWIGNADKKCDCGIKFSEEGHTNPDCVEFTVRTSEKEIEQLDRFMQSHQTPTSPDPHTAGKAHCYLREALKLDLNNGLGWKASRFIDGCRGVSSGRLQWKDLSNRMRGWF